MKSNLRKKCATLVFNSMTEHGLPVVQDPRNPYVMTITVKDADTGEEKTFRIMTKELSA